MSVSHKIVKGQEYFKENVNVSKSVHIYGTIFLTSLSLGLLEKVYGYFRNSGRSFVS